MSDNEDVGFDDILYRSTDFLSVDTGFMYKYDNTLAHYLTAAFKEKITGLVLQALKPGKYFLAGGAIRAYYENREVRDLDIYVLSEDTFDAIQAEALAAQKEENRKRKDGLVFDFNDVGAVAKKKRNTEYQCGEYRWGEYKYPYKIIRYVSFDKAGVQFFHVKYVPDFFGRQKSLPKPADLKPEDYITATTPYEILEGFDFTCCQAGVEFEVTREKYGKTHISITGLRQEPMFLTSIAKRELRVVPLGNMQKCGVGYVRLVKYISEYGYKIPDADSYKQLERIRTLGIITGYDPDDNYYGDNI